MSFAYLLIEFRSLLKRKEKGNAAIFYRSLFVKMSASVPVNCVKKLYNGK